MNKINRNIGFERGPRRTLAGFAFLFQLLRLPHRENNAFSVFGYSDVFSDSKLDEKSVDDLVEDGREFVRKSPGKALGIAAIVGFMLSRLFRGSR